MNRATFIAMAVLAAAAGLYGVSQGDRAEEGGRQASATATTASTLRTTSTTSTTVSRAVPRDTDTTSTPSATVPAGCRSSTDPRCGPFYWDPQPVADRPLVVDVLVTPDAPRVGEQVTFEIDYADPDAPELACLVLAFGDEPSATHCDTAPGRCGRYGPWPPPVPQRLEVRRVEVHTYQQPGTYEVLVGGTSRTPGTDPACTDSRTRRPGDPFGASAQVRIQVVIGT